ALARTFVAYVLSPAGQSDLRRSGFIPGVRRLASGVRAVPWDQAERRMPNAERLHGAPGAATVVGTP
ncbi:MAG TPA: hypothetical protein VK898_09415, partial [Chloroflexota bacterium]|nr:hypothetical protein [Chloroflexota bacterium]